MTQVIDVSHQSNPPYVHQSKEECAYFFQHCLVNLGTATVDKFVKRKYYAANAWVKPVSGDKAF